MKFLFLFTLITVCGCSHGQIYSDIARGGSIVLYDNAEAVPAISWPTAKSKGYMMITGPEQGGKMNEIMPSSWIVVKKGEHGAPAPRAGLSCYRANITKPAYYGGRDGGTRVELYWGGACKEYTGAEWSAISIFLPDDFCFDSRPVGLAFNSKYPDAKGEASFYLKLEKGQWQASRKYPQGADEERTFVGVAEKGKWIDFVFHRNFRDDDRGFLELYMDRKRVWSHKGPNFSMDCGPDTEGYMLFGIYKWSWLDAGGQGEGQGNECGNRPITVYYDELKIGNNKATLESISPAGAPPGK